MAVERRSALTKATTPDDPLAGMGTEPQEVVAAPVVAAKPARQRKARSQPATAAAAASEVPAAPVTAPRPVGRPRTRPLQVTFSSKVDLDVRARLDAWEYETGEKIVELLDRALRGAMGMPESGSTTEA